MRPSSYELAPDVADTDVIANDAGEYNLAGFGNDTTDSAGFLTITVHEVGDGFAHKVRFTPSGSVTGNYVLVGTDADGVANGETLATDGTNAVTSVNFYLTLTSVATPSGLGAETVDVGWIQDGAKLTLDTTSTSDGLAHKLTLTPSGAVSGNYTIAGTDFYDNAISETLATNAGSAVTSVNYYKTVTSVVAAVMTDKTVDIGISGATSATIYPIDFYSPFACNIQVGVTGTINYTVQETFGSVFNGNTDELVWSDITALTSKTSSLTGSATVGATAIRTLINSFSSGGSVEVFTSQPVFI